MVGRIVVGIGGGGGGGAGDVCAGVGDEWFDHHAGGVLRRNGVAADVWLGIAAWGDGAGADDG